MKLYVKLPDWFKVPTPLGNYNPDWAIVMKDPEQLLYFISETKSTLELDRLPYAHEGLKIKCGRQHFEGALGVPYRVMASADDLPKRGLEV